MLPSHAWRVHDRTRSGILIDARDYYLAFYDAARHAKRSILLLGWQFDSDVQLVRGADVPLGVASESVRLLPFLNSLCRSRPELEVRVLAWDHSLWFALEREVLQKLSFDLRAHERFHFETDATVAEYGAHHQKVAVIDGRVAFLGSNDIAQERWDTSAHAPDDPLRVGRSGQGCKPYHEVQAVLTGAAARSLVDMFVERWADATGQTLDAEALAPPVRDDRLPVQVTMEMPAGPVGLYRALPHRFGRAPVREVRDLLLSFIASAERLVYIETQYLSSQVIAEALVARMKEPGRPKLDIVVVLPRRPEALKEELAMGATQAKVIAELGLVARETGHALGLYNVCATRADGSEVFVYIHSKLVIVDDRCMTVGSANLNNRSMTLDSEVNAAWIADGEPMIGGIRAVRTRLLREHVGLSVRDDLFDDHELVRRMDALAASRSGRLRHYDEGDEPSLLMKLGQKIASAYADPTHSPESRETPLLFDGPAPDQPR